MRWCGFGSGKACIKRSTRLLKSLKSQVFNPEGFCPPPWLASVSYTHLTLPTNREV